MPIKFEDDCASSPGILGRIKPDAGLCAVFNISMITACSVYISPLASLVAIGFAVKDICYHHKKDTQEIDKLTQKLLGGSDNDERVLPPTTVDVPVQPANVASDSTHTALPTNASELLSQLETQCPDLLLLVKSAPIRLIGKQRTGKSTFARKLALLRAVLLPGHTVIWATPHREADNPVPNSLNPFGTTANGAKDFSAIERVWQATQAAIDNGQQLNTTAVWDEFGSYDAFENEEVLGKSLKSMLRGATKHSYFPILVAHGDQASFYPGVKNILGMLHSSTVKVETFGKVANAFGEMKPTGEVEITWLNGSTTQFKVPEWLTVDLLLSLQPSMLKPALLDTIAASVSAVTTPQVQPISESPHVAVEAVQPSAEETLQQRVSNKLLEKLKASGNEWISSRDLVSRSFSQEDDRDMAKRILDTAVNKQMIEYEAIANPNGAETVRYRVKPKV